jgi:hypothetical protein
LKFIGFDQGDENLKTVLNKADARKALSVYIGEELADDAAADAAITTLINSDELGLVSFTAHIYKDKLQRKAVERELEGKTKVEKTYPNLEKSFASVKDLSNLSEEDFALMILQKKIAIAPSSKNTTPDSGDISLALQGYGVQEKRANQIGLYLSKTDLLTYGQATGWELNPQGKWRSPEAIAYLVGTGQMSESEASSMAHTTNPADANYFDNEIKSRSAIFNSTLPEPARKTALGKWNFKNLATIVAISPGILQSLVSIMTPEQKDQLSEALKP